MDMITREDEQAGDVREVRICSGITPKEVETVLNMAAACGLFSAEALISAEDMAWDSAYGDGDEMQTFLLAKVSDDGRDKVIGFICFGPILHWAGDFELFGITVEPEFRRLGIGSALMEEMTRRIGDDGGKRIFLETGMDEAFEEARLFYEANDFSQQHRFCKQFIPLDGGIVYRLTIDTGDLDENYQ